LIQAAKQSYSEHKPFCLVRFPGEKHIFFGYASKTKPTSQDFFIAKGWDANSEAVYYAKQAPSSGVIREVLTSNQSIKETDFKDYTAQFKNYLEHFEKRQIQKAILSRLKLVAKPERFDPFDTYERACLAYPETLAYIMSHPTEGLWLGASPEILLQKRARWKTVSLAGTQPVKNTGYIWGVKEQREQELVSVHLRKTLSQLRATNILESAVETATSGAVAHLKTFFEFDSDKKIHEILESLHPTPAIAGLPVDKAIELISETERHQRRLYTGYLGRISREKVDLYVNLRCMQIFESELGLYLGGGITAQSNLESEWDETEMKAQTLLKITHGKKEN